MSLSDEETLCEPNLWGRDAAWTISAQSRLVPNCIARQAREMTPHRSCVALTTHLTQTMSPQSGVTMWVRPKAPRLAPGDPPTQPSLENSLRGILRQHWAFLHGTIGCFWLSFLFGS